MAKATTTIRQTLNHQPDHGFAANATLFNQVCAFYFEVIAAHEKILDLCNKEAEQMIKLSPVAYLLYIREGLQPRSIAQSLQQSSRRWLFSV